MWGKAALALTAFGAYKIAFPSEIKSVKGKTCLITGAGGGLGLALIKELRGRGAGKLILWDIKQDAVDRAAKAAQGGAFETDIVDMSKRENIYAAVEKTLKDLPHYVFNVAGIVSGAYVNDATDEMDLLTFSVNALAHLWMVKAYLPHFEKRGEGHFVNVASMAALVGAPGMVAYAASKSAALMMCEALYAELEHRGSKIRVTCVCPSHFHTPLFAGFEFTGNLSMTPEYVAYRAVQGALAERQLVLLPQYLIAGMPLAQLYRMFGYYNAPPLDRKNPMGNWQGSDHAKDVFRAMGAKL